MPRALQQAAMYDLIMRRYSFQTPQQVNASWSRALLYVMYEAILHAEYVPPHEDEQKPKPSLISAFGIKHRKGKGAK